MLKGLIDFRSEFKKDKYWLEVFFIADLNDDDEQVDDHRQHRPVDKEVGEFHLVSYSPAVGSA